MEQPTGRINLGDNASAELSHQEMFDFAVELALDLGEVSKTWMCSFLPNSREEHKEADGETRSLQSYFSVGGISALHPGDPALPADQRINCKCRIRYTDANGVDITGRLRRRGFPVRATSEWGPNYGPDGVPFAGTGNISLGSVEVKFELVAADWVTAAGKKPAARARARCPEGSGDAGGEFTGPNATNCDVGAGAASVGQTVPVGGPPVDPAYHTRGKDGSGNPYNKDNPYTESQPYGPDYNKKGKPLVGNDEWLEAHGMTRQEFDGRPFTRFEAGDTAEIIAEYGSPEALALYDGKENALKMMLGISEGKIEGGGVGGFVAKRYPVDAEMQEKHGIVIGQIRPDEAVVINPSERAYRARTLDNAEKNLVEAQAMDHAGAIAKQENRVEKAKEWQKTVDTKYTSPEAMVADSEQKLNEAKATKADAASVVKAEAQAAGVKAKTQKERKEAAKVGGDNLTEAEKVLGEAETLQARAARAHAEMKDQAGRWERKPGSFETDKERMQFNAKRGIETAEQKLADYKRSDPEKTIEVEAQDKNGKTIFDKDGNPKVKELRPPVEREIENATNTRNTAKDQFDKTAIKYAFPPTPKDANGNPIKGRGTAARVELPGGGPVGTEHHDELNVKNFTETKGRVYLAMEGSIKASAILSAIKAEEPGASVIAVPSVTLWRTQEMNDVARKYLRGREVVLVPDADGVNNRNVRNESRALQALLENAGARVVVAAPPIPLDAKGKTIKVAANGKVALYSGPLGSGAKEELKGVDDWLGVGDRAEPWVGTPHGRTTGDVTSVADHPGQLKGLVYTDRKVPKINLVDSKGNPTVSGIKSAEAMAKAISTVAGPGGAVKVSESMLVAASGLPRQTARDALQNLKAAGVIKIEQVHDPDAMRAGRRVRNGEVSDDRVKELVRAGIISDPASEEDEPFADTTQESSIYTLVNSAHHAVDADRPVSLAERDSKRQPSRPSSTRPKNATGTIKTESEPAKPAASQTDAELRAVAKTVALAQGYAEGSTAYRRAINSYINDHS